MKTNIRNTFGTLCLILAGFAPRSSEAQTYQEASPVDLYESQIAFINPAAIAFQDAQFVVGSRILHYGFVSNNSDGLSNSFMNVSFPSLTPLNIGAGLIASNLKASIYSENRLNLITSLKFDDKIGVGVQVGLYSRSFDLSGAVIVDPGDPILEDGASKLLFNMGAGVFYQVNDQLQLGLGVENINRPDISLENLSIRQNSVMNIAANYNFKNWGEASLGYLWNGDRFLPMLGLTTSVQGIGALKFGLLTGNFDVGTQLHITEKISFDYRYSMPISDINSYSNGSHRVSFAYRFGDIPTVDFEISASEDSLRIVERKLAQRFEDGLGPDATGSFDLMRGLKDALDPINHYYRFTPFADPRTVTEADVESYVRAFGYVIEPLAEKLAANATMRARIIASKNKTHVAKALCGYLSEKYGVAQHRLEYGFIENKTHALLHNGTNGDAHEKNVTTQPNEMTMFSITPIIKRKYNRMNGIKSWKFIIENSRGEPVRVFQGKEAPPEKLFWDWTGSDGKTVGVGKYGYYLQWQSKGSSVQKSRKNFVHVSKFVREIDVLFSRKILIQEAEPQRVDLHLGI